MRTDNVTADAIIARTEAHHTDFVGSLNKSKKLSALRTESVTTNTITARTEAHTHRLLRIVKQVQKAQCAFANM